MFQWNKEYDKKDVEQLIFERLIRWKDFTNSP